MENPLSQLAHAHALAIVLVILLGLFGGAVNFLWTFALTHLSPTQVAVYANLNPMAATLLGATLLGEKLTATFLAGLGAVLTGVLLVNIRPKK
ncbi:MAG TPA: DMT family transporter [Syntrophorhabdaceae bacterium]|nr:DMT family transporter [Syntrophorhabdaceae bacterium]